MGKKSSRTLLSLSAVALMAAVHSPSVMAAPQSRAAERVPESADSLSPELRAALKLIESSNQLNQTAIELVRATVAGQRHKPESPLKTGVVSEAITEDVPADVSDEDHDSVRHPVSESSNGVYFGTAVPVGESVNGIYFGESVANPADPGQTQPPHVAQETTAGEGGSYVWVPDSLAERVNAFLLEPQQRLLFRDTATLEDMIARTIDGGEVSSAPVGDTQVNVVALPPENDPEVLRTRNIGRFDRGLFNYRFIPKGEWAFGLTVSYGEFNTEDMELLSIMKDFDFGGHSFAIRPQLQYFLRDNLSIGLRFNYTQTKGRIGNVDMDFGDDLNLNVHDVSYNGESYAASFTFTQYLGLSRRGRFGVFNEAELAFSSGSSDFIRPFGGVLKTTHTTTTGVSLNYSPGLSVFMMKNASFNISFGVFGFSLKNEKQWVDSVESGNRLTSGINFRFNIFNIKFGLAIHI